MANAPGSSSKNQQQITLAIGLHNAGRHQEAEQLCVTILEHQATHPEALHLLGIIHAQRADFANAEQLIGNAVNANGKNAFFLNSHGSVLDSLGRHDEAIRALQNAIKIKTIFPEAYNNLGVALQHSGAVDAAVTAFRQSLRQKPNYPEAVCNLGNALKQQGNYQAAIEAYRAALKIFPNHFKATNNLGIALLETGRNAEARAQFDQCLAMQDNNPDLYFNRGIASFRRKHYLEAVSDFEHVLRLAPDYANVYAHIAKTVYELGEDDLAMQQFLVELERNPQHHEALYGLASICFSRELREDYWTLTHAALASPNIDELQRNETLISQAIEAWLEKQPDVSVQCLSQSASIRTMAPSSLNNVHFMQAYHLYLDALNRYRQENPARYTEGDERTIFVIGDSHSLAAHGYRIENVSKIESRLVTGTKVWHIANPQPNRFKTALRHAIASLPDGCDAVFTFGEIDCRPGEGVLPFLKKHPQDLKAYMLNLISSYVVNILEEIRARNITATFCGVPAPGYDLGSLPQEDHTQLLEIISCFNQTLETVAKAGGCRFVDLYAGTRSADEINGRTPHLDGYHLQPHLLANLISQTVCRPYQS